MNLDKHITTQEEARQFAIDWQNWASGESLDYMTLGKWQTIFIDLAEEFDLTEEFKENGII